MPTLEVPRRIYAEGATYALFSWCQSPNTAVVREVLTGIGDPPVLAGDVPATSVQATAYSLLPTPPPLSSADVAASISIITSQVTEQQRNVFLALSDKEFRDHFAKTFGL